MQGYKPKLELVAQAFHEFHIEAARISRQSIRNPEQWQKEMDIACAKLRSKLDSLCLAEHIDWSVDE